MQLLLKYLLISVSLVREVGKPNNRKTAILMK